MRIPLSILTVVAAVSTTAMAQRVGPAPHFQGRPSGFHSGFGHAGRASLAYPFPFYDPLAWDYPAASTSTTPQPQVVVVQSAATPQPPEAIHEPSPPLVIELRGDSYVQVSGNDESKSE